MNLRKKVAQTAPRFLLTNSEKVSSRSFRPLLHKNWFQHLTQAVIKRLTKFLGVEGEDMHAVMGVDRRLQVIERPPDIPTKNPTLGLIRQDAKAVVVRYAALESGSEPSESGGRVAYRSHSQKTCWCGWPR